MELIARTFGYSELNPYGRFHLVEHRWPGNGSDALVLVGESATLVGWIPFYQSSGQLADGFLKEAWDSGNSSVPLLLNSGNNPPPDHFAGPGALERFMGLHEFRAVLSIDAPTLWLNAQGDPTLLQFLAMAQVGATPFRAEYLISPRIWFTRHSGGDARVSGNVCQRPESIKVRLFIRMRLGWLGRKVGRILEGDEPPWANMMIEYEFHFRERFARVSFWGTAVPSQHHYMNWKKVSGYEIEHEMSGAAYHGFVRAGGGMDALPERYHTLLCGLKAEPISADPPTRNRPFADEGGGGQ